MKTTLSGSRRAGLFRRGGWINGVLDKLRPKILNALKIISPLILEFFIRFEVGMVDRVSAASYAMLCLREEIDRASFHALLRLQALSADQAFQTVGIGR